MSSTQLTDRVLFSDGDSVVPITTVMSLLASGINTDGVFVNEVTDEIAQFNKYVPKNKQITVKLSTAPNDISWNLPHEYANIDPMVYTIRQFNKVAEVEHFVGAEPEFSNRKNRIVQELSMFESLNLLPVLSVLIYIINTLREENVVWGVGRGSSVSSYVLYVLGVHDVDSVTYNLDIQDFLRI